MLNLEIANTSFDVDTWKYGTIIMVPKWIVADII
jgi:hypothetical protein